MTSSRWLASLVLVLLMVGPRPGLAQREMYGMGGTTAEDQRRQLQAEARRQVSSLLADYESAWGSRDARALVQLYAREAVLWPGGSGPLTGRDSLARYFTRLLPTVAPMRSRILEFRLGSELAYATLETVRQTPLGADSLLETTGTDVMLLERDPLGDWAIVWHLIRPEHVARRAVPREPPRPAGVTAAGPQTPAAGASPAEARRGFEGLMEAWKAALAGHDSAAVAALFTDDALLAFVDGVPVRGRAAIARWAAGAAGTLATLRTGVGTVRAGGTLAYLSGRFAVEGTPAGGTFVAVLAAEDGQWRIQSQVFLPDRPR